MTERERLFELLENGFFEALSKCKGENKDKKVCDYLADYLLENGVIVPVPAVKIGTTVYEIRQKGISFSNRRYDSGITTKKQLKNAIFDGKTLYIESKLYAKSDNVRLGKTVFLTREDAEAALALKGGDSPENRTD